VSWGGGKAVERTRFFMEGNKSGTYDPRYFSRLISHELFPEWEHPPVHYTDV